MELLNDMTLFVAVVKARGFRRAAEATGVPNSTLSRRISTLEKAIGLRLLNRTTRKFELTEAGQIYYERCRRIVDEARSAHEQLGEMLAQPSGVLRISAPVDFAVSFLTPHLKEFCERFPRLSIDIDLTPRVVDLVSEPFDLAIRIGELPDSALIARPIARLTGVVLASPSYLEAHGAPMELSDLARHECLRMQKRSTWTLYDGTTRQDVKVNGRLVLNNVGIIRRLAIMGMGIAMMPKIVVGEDLAEGRLRHILPQWEGPKVLIHAVTETRLLPAKTQRFIDFLQERLRSI